MDTNNCEMACSIISKYQPLLYLSTVDSINVTLLSSLLSEEVSTHIASSSYSDPDIRHPPALKLSSSRLLVTRPCLVSGVTQLVRHRHTPQLCDHLCRLELVVLSP